MRVRSSRFVGRERELGQLLDWLADAREGRPRVVIVGGEAGVGKSRLVQELGRAATEQACRWLLGAAADYGGGGLPFEAVVGALRPVAASGREPLAAGLGPLRSELAHLFPSLAGSGGLARAGPDEGMAALDKLRQLRLLEGLLRLLELVAAQEPTMLVLEDLHWADASTRDFLAFLARNLGSSRLLVVGTYRSDDVDRGHPLRRYLSELERTAGIERLELSRFGRHELRELVEAISGTGIDDLLVDELFERSQGNAFFAEELLAETARGAAAEVLPDSLRDIVLARVERLSPAGRSILSAAAVAGTATERLLSQVTGLSEEAVSAALHEALDHHVLERVAAPIGYAFRHALAREAIYDDLLAGERFHLHERVARALEASADSEQTTDAQLLAQLAHHWRQVGRPKESFLASWRAGMAAERAHANAEASLHYEQALSVWDHVEQPEQLLQHEFARAADGGRASAFADRIELAVRAGWTAHSANEHERASVLLRLAASAIDADAQPDRAAEIYGLLMWSLLLGRHADEAARIKRRLEQHLSACSPSGRFNGLRDLIGYLSHFAEFSEAQPLMLEAAGLAASVGDIRGKADLLIQAGLARSFHAGLGEGLDAGLAEIARGRSLAIEIGDPFLPGIADKERGIVLQAAGRFREAIEAFEGSQELLVPLGLHHITRHTDAEIGFAHHRLGNWREADAALERAMTPPANEWAYVVRAYVLVMTGRLEAAELELKRAWPSVASSQIATSYGPYFAALTAKRIWEGQPQAALDVVEEGMRYVDMFRWICELVALGIRAAAEHRPPARHRAKKLLAYMEWEFPPEWFERRPEGGEIRAWRLTAEAEMSRVRGKPDVRRWKLAAEVWRRAGRPHDLAYALYRQAEAALGGGKRELAREPLAEAWSVASAAGARLLVREVEALARRARLKVGQAQADISAADTYGLTSREREVLALLARGRTDQQIATELFISPKTASVHVSHIKAKLGVEHRIEAASIAAGLTDDA